MKVQAAKLPTLHEDQSKWETSSQDTRIDGFINSDHPFALNAARLEQQMRNAEIVAPSPAQPLQHVAIQQPRQIIRTAKNFCYRAALVCGALIIPSFGFLALGVFGLLAPAAFFVAGILLLAVAGRPTEEMQTEIENRRNEMRNFDCRGSV